MIYAKQPTKRFFCSLEGTQRTKGPLINRTRHPPPAALDRPTAQSAGCLGQRLIGAIPGKNLKISIRWLCCKAQTLVFISDSVISVQIRNIRAFRVPLSESVFDKPGLVIRKCHFEQRQAAGEIYLLNFCLKRSLLPVLPVVACLTAA